MFVISMNGLGTSVDMTSWNNMTFLGLTGGTKILEPSRK